MNMIYYDNSWMHKYRSGYDPVYIFVSKIFRVSIQISSLVSQMLVRLINHLDNAQKRSSSLTMTDNL